MLNPLNRQTVAVIIPALNEEEAISHVLGDLPVDLLDQIIVVDNGSTDHTAEVARSMGATVVLEPRRGYGQACLSGIAALGAAEIVVFLDGDYSDHPNELPQVIAPISADQADLVIGSRVLGNRQRGALTVQQRWGNALATWLIRWFFGVRYTDLGPFRAVRRTALDALNMADRDFGWTVEMQVKAARTGIRITEVPVSYRPRIGTSKISGTIRGTFKAGHKILSIIFRHGWDRAS